jgi:hypothetical protein
MTTFRVAVLSDIHAYENESGDSYSLTEPPRGLLGQHPLRDLISLIQSRQLQVDLVISPGDLTNKASTAGTSYAWAMLHEIAAQLGTTTVIGTPGNHDLITHGPSADPSAALRSLTPSFPSGNEFNDDRFWREGYFLDDSRPVARLLNINSCIEFPRHPGLAASAVEMQNYNTAIDRGAFSRDTQAQVETELATLAYKPVNIAICHHHPLEHQNMAVFQDSYGPMRRGGDLVQTLANASGSGRWMIIHGHKHVPLLTTEGSSSNAPILFCAASVGGKLWHPVVTVTRNQFHIIEFETDHTTGLPDTRGSVTSYMWGFGTGWVPALPHSGLPFAAGFGTTHDFRLLAQIAVERLTINDLLFLRWNDLVEDLPILRYQGPVDMSLLENELARLGFIIERDSDGMPLNLSKEVTHDRN